MPSATQISMSDINTELGYAYNRQISLNDSAVRSLAGIPSGQISIRNFRVSRFSFTGGTQYWTVPTGVTSVLVKVWGGGGASASGPNGPLGGGGGYVQGDIAVTPGQTLTINVGEGGRGWNSDEGYGGNAFPAGGNGANSGGGGGGRSEVFYGSAGLIAGGGGASGYSFGGTGGNGGPGGYYGAAGGDGYDSCNGVANCFGGAGGTIYGGGAGGYGSGNTGYSGGYNYGGDHHNASIPGGAGGDGYYGGGAGGSGNTGCGDAGGGGGGGCSYGYNVSNLVYLNGSSSTPGNASDGDRPTSGQSYLGNYGTGQGASSSGYRGGKGYVVVRY
jgi:hypothetical protein